ncbi:hypothetical protein CC85DRAFT_282240 [Cutaneotrichosporon oleaginosum]|uniref:Uncharacterized protein n=1 Tax=Cutaneotrichosporon oleaginosum TaxID=879819 RepID=A0A0J0XX33_9TREE|nr:uncharacterized protein CC85DRAFT_282240 [Cutaneotrichosporon oleaginosum]KLT45615.1 hypothetical protein CC85DRAFT_282240 [Cutaneotrichosporon oleaginosum]TXT04589.1 hypothetical protein COLE_07408 [Cutaneotrichosporon oleaginosum]
MARPKAQVCNIARLLKSARASTPSQTSRAPICVSAHPIPTSRARHDDAFASPNAHPAAITLPKHQHQLRHRLSSTPGRERKP